MTFPCALQDSPHEELDVTLLQYPQSSLPFASQRGRGGAVCVTPRQAGGVWQGERLLSSGAGLYFSCAKRKGDLFFLPPQTRLTSSDCERAGRVLSLKPQPRRSRAAL